MHIRKKVGDSLALALALALVKYEHLSIRIHNVQQLHLCWVFGSKRVDDLIQIEHEIVTNMY